MKSKENKILSLQALRGGAALAIVVHHIIQSYYFYDVSEFFTQLNKWLPLGVDVFFVLSGYIIAKCSLLEKRPLNFLKKRLYRVIPIYWFYTLVIIISIEIFPESYITDWDFETLFYSLFLIPHENLNGYGHYPVLYVGWSLIYEMFFYFIFSLSIVFSKEKRLTIVIFVTCLLSMIMPKMLGQSSYYLIEFATGCVIYVVINISNRQNVLILIFYLTCMAILLMGPESGYYVKRSVLSGTIVIIFILSEIKLKLNVNWVLVKLGDISYSLYLSHVIIIGWVLELTRYYKIEDKNNAIMLIFIGCLSLSYITYKNIEQRNH
ncbi:acyltransferase family protein [Vibrio cyclitrophicus]